MLLPEQPLLFFYIQNVGDKKYFAYYADFAHQELMLNDVVRTSVALPLARERSACGMPPHNASGFASALRHLSASHSAEPRRF